MPVARHVLECGEPIPPSAVWIDMIERTQHEDREVQGYLRCNIPTRDDPDYLEPPEAYYAENGVRYLQASVVSEPEDTPDVIGVTFIICGLTLVTVRYEASDAFEIFGQKLCKSWDRALEPSQSPSGSTRSSTAPRARSAQWRERGRDRGRRLQGRPRR